MLDFIFTDYVESSVVSDKAQGFVAHYRRT